jgi:hypothetical protein
MAMVSSASADFTVVQVVYGVHGQHLNACVDATVEPVVFKRTRNKRKKKTNCFIGISF